MALGIPTGGARTPIVKFDARAGRWFRVDGKDQVTDVTNGFTAVFDLSQIEIGWAKFAAGQAPDVSFARVPAPMPQQPSIDHRRAVRLHVKLAKSLGGDMRELMTQASIVMQAIDQLHDAYTAAPEAAQGMLPVVACPTTEAVTISTGAGKSTNYKPVLQIVSWVARPAELPLTDAPVPKPVAAPVAPAATGSTVVPPPAPRAATVPAPSGDTEF
jgi:hypothetical protein